MNSSVQKKEEPGYNRDVEIIETVRSCVFPRSTDAELRLFMFKCQEVGVHPLSQMIIPVVFEGNEGRKVSFIATIDFFRAQSEDAGDYAGMDDIEYEGEVEDEYDGKKFTHPEIAICKVYRTGFDRPFIGKARWSEFYPDGKKGHKWRQMPFHMLGKCAEAQARRIAWAKKLSKLYTEEEMDQGFAALADGSVSTSKKPNISPDDIEVTETGSTDDSSDIKNLERPSDDQRKAGKLISEKQAFFLYAECKKAGVDIYSVAAAAKVKNIFWITWQKSSAVCMDKLLPIIQNKPNSFAKFSKPAETASRAPTIPANSEVPDVMGAEEFASLLASFALRANITVEDGLKEGFQIDSIEDVFPEMQSKIIDWFTMKAEAAGA